MSKFNATYFIKVYEGIPEDKWTVGEMVSVCGEHCALGHLAFDNKRESGALNGISRLFNKYLKTTVPFVNDGDDTRFKQATPRERVLAALFTIKAIRQRGQYAA